MLTLSLLATAFPLAQWLPEVLTKTAAMTIWVLHAPLTINALEQQMGCVDRETFVQSVYTMRTCRSGQQYFTIFTDIAKPDELYLMLAEQQVQPSPLPQSLSGLAKVADADIEDNGQRVVSIQVNRSREQLVRYFQLRMAHREPTVEVMNDHYLLLSLKHPQEQIVLAKEGTDTLVVSMSENHHD